LFNELDKAIIRKLQQDLPLDPQPFRIIAEELGITEGELLAKVKEFKEKGYIRRLGAALRHRQMGLKANPMIVWQVPEERVEEVGKKLASFPQVTHCYQRPMLPKLRYNLYSMIHGETREQCYELAEEMAKVVGIKTYQLLFSEEEFKKTSMQYFVED